MRNNCYKMLSCLIAVLGIICMFGPLKARASFPKDIYVIDATDTSITIDWEETLEQTVLDYASVIKTNVTFNEFRVCCIKNPNSSNERESARNNASIVLSPSTKQYTFTGLELNSSYYVAVMWKGKSEGVNGYGNPSSYFELNNAYTTATPKTAELLGTTGTTATVDFRNQLKEIYLDYVADGYVIKEYDVCVGYAEQTGTVDDAQKKARKQAGRKSIHLTRNQGTYMMRGLTPGHSYVFTANVTISYKDENDNSYTTTRYIELTGITPQGEDDSDTYKMLAQDIRYDRTSDPGTKDLWGFDTINSPDFDISVTKDSITIDWSKQSNSNMVVKAATGETDICIAYVKDEEYDPVADRKQYGKNYSGVNARKARSKVESSRKTIPVSQKSYTITGLEPATSYTVVLKCGYNTNSMKCDRAYFYRTRLYTEGAPTSFQYERDLEATVQKAYLYDNVSVRRNGAVADIDWSEALNAYHGQTAFTNHYAQLYPTNTYNSYACFIGYEKLPATATDEAVQKAYDKALANTKNVNYSSQIVEYPYTNCRIYGLDLNAKYVFAITFTSVWHHFGEAFSISDTLYSDDTGINYLKAKATNATYNAGSTSGQGGDPGSGSSGSGDSGEGGSGSSGEAGSDTGGSGSSGEGGQGNSSSAGSTSGVPAWNANQGGFTGYQPAGSDKVSADGKETSYKYLNKKKADRVWISYDFNKLSYSKLAKKAQTVTLRIENSSGKIKVKNASGDKLSDSVKIKVKGRKVILTFKKGAPKGTYKFDVTVEGKGKIKKTKETLKVKVK